MEATEHTPVWPGWNPGTAQPLGAAATDFERVGRRWTASAVRSRRIWRHWAKEHQELAPIDALAPWDLSLGPHRLAFAALSELARSSDDAMSAWCAKATPLWRNHFGAAHGRYHENVDASRQRWSRNVATEGASMAALAIALCTFEGNELRRKSYPFHAVMARARQAERTRPRAPKNTSVDPRQISKSPSDGMDDLVGMVSTIGMLRHMINTHEPQHQESLRTSLEHQVDLFLGVAEWSPDRAKENRKKFKRCRSRIERDRKLVA